MELVERRHPCGDLLHTKLVSQNEILLCDLRLFSERLYLHFKLFNFIVYAKEIVLRLFQLALRLLLAVAVAGDARRLFKDLAPVRGLCGDNFADAPLSDDGIAVPSETGIHQQTVYIL